MPLAIALAVFVIVFAVRIFWGGTESRHIGGSPLPQTELAPPANPAPSQ